MINDTISDMLTRLRNAINAEHKVVQVPHTKITKNICILLQKEGLITTAKEVGHGIEKQILIILKYDEVKNLSIITNLKRISKPGLRVYSSNKKLPRVLGGFGMAIISTSKGLMTDKMARHLGVGGEILCYIW
uniref:Ribosomal protein S8 n=1 Tax=Cyanidium sp. THAL103 TaxID=3027999 RepID=A0A9Y1MYK2_9RHOD|nr:ribosomal protein S8 [Cyanidium sp. THAL103]